MIEDRFYMPEDHECWQELANAVLVSAAREYMILKVRYLKGDKSIRGQLYQLNRFFKSDRIKIYTNVDSSFLLKCLNEEVDRRLHRG